MCLCFNSSPKGLHLSLEDIKPPPLQRQVTRHFKSYAVSPNVTQFRKCGDLVSQLFTKPTRKIGSVCIHQELTEISIHFVPPGHINFPDLSHNTGKMLGKIFNRYVVIFVCFFKLLLTNVGYHYSQDGFKIDRPM